MKIGFVILAVLILGGAAIAYATNTSDEMVSGKWRYRQTVTIETPEGLKTGSAVREINEYWAPNDDVLSANGATWVFARAKAHLDKMEPALRGEAVVIDLGKRGVVFALLKGGKRGEDYAKRLPNEIFPFSGPDYSPEGIAYYSSLKNARAVLDPTDYPIMVTFRDMKDPKSIELVYQNMPVNVQNQSHFDYAVTDRFEELFGKGVKLKEITFEMTDDPVTLGIDKVLGWLAGLEGGYLDGGFTSRNAPLGLYGGNFKTGEQK